MKIAPVDKTKHVQVYQQEHQMCFEWESFEQLDDDLTEMQGRAAGYYANHSSHGYNWWGCASPERLKEHVRSGWPELREEALKLLSDVEFNVPATISRNIVRRRKIRNADHGDELHMPRVWNGELDVAWSLPKRFDIHRISTKRVTLAVDVGTHCGLDNKSAMWRAALTIKLADALVRAGKVFEVWAVATAKNVFDNHNPDQVTLSTCIKRTNDPLVLDRLASMVSMGYHRCCGFEAFHAVKSWHVNYLYGYYPGGHERLPETLEDRRSAGELVLHLKRAFSRDAALREYNRAWEEVEKHTVTAYEQS